MALTQLLFPSALIKTSTPGAGTLAVKFSVAFVVAGFGVGVAVTSATTSLGELKAETTTDPMAITVMIPNVEAIINDQLVPDLARKFSNG